MQYVQRTLIQSHREGNRAAGQPIMTSSSDRSDRYRQAGVDIEAGNSFVEAIKPLAKATARAGVAGGLGGFGGLFDLKAAGFNDPILVAATDGVGTKLKIAQAAGRHDTIGIDLVAMCVNDLIVQGAEPLFFLDYLASGKLEIAVQRDVVAGISEGCLQAGCGLIGGETAEMPGMYQGGDYDVAGFSVGAAERGHLLPRAGIQAGDVLLGLASSGVHSNGFSLIRHLVGEAGFDYGAPAPFQNDTTLAEALLTPTRIYVKPCMAAVKAGLIKAMAHITGGGLLENIPRVLPEGVAARLDATAWPLPPVFAWAAEVGGLEAKELARTFNSGLGMVLVVAEADADAATRTLEDAGENVYRVGVIETCGADGEPVVIEGMEAAWPSAR